MEYSVVRYSPTPCSPADERPRDPRRRYEESQQNSGLSQEELALRAAIDRTYVCALERRMYAASVDLVARLADALEVGPDTLLRRPHFTLTRFAQR
jgi:ribosome-binding protein aMBF1 (putative translation factor)